MNNSKKKILWLGMIFPLVALACGLLVPSTVPTEEVVALTVPSPTAVSAPISLPAALTNEEAVLMDLYNRANPSVVNIIVYFQEGDNVLPSGQGSGFVYDEQGYIVTNAHVVHSADEVDVIFSDSTTRRGDLVGLDLHSDLAVVKVESLPEGVQRLPLGDMNEVAVGQTVVAIGNPFGLGGTLTRGIVSAMGRTIPALTPFSIPQSIQTDAPINPGNSGGPLLNLEGEVIGVNAQIETDGDNRANSGVGFAIPVSIVKLVVPDLIENGEHSWAWLGVRGGSLFPALVEAMELPVEKGAYMSEIISDGPSDQAGLRGSSGTRTIDGRTVEVGGDVIVAIDGEPVNSFEDLLIYVSLEAGPGQEVVLTVLRDGEYEEITVTLEERPGTLDIFP